MPHPVARLQQGQGAADHHRGVGLGRHENVGAHGGGGGLAVGARDAKGVAVVPHDGPPGLGPLEDGDTRVQRGLDFGVPVVDGGGAHHAAGPLHAFGPVADGHRDAQASQVEHRGALPLVGASHLHPRPVEHLRQGGHGHPADAHQMGPLPRLQIVADIFDFHIHYLI